MTKKLFSTTNCSITTGGTTSGSSDVFYGYDLLGRKLYANYLSATGSGVAWTYDAPGHVLTEAAGGRTLSYTYSVSGDRTKITWPGSIYNVKYTFDAADHVSTALWAGTSNLATYTWDEMYELTNVSRAGGSSVATSPAWDDRLRLTGLTHNFAGTANDITLLWGYTPASQVATRSESNSTYTWPNSPGTQAYTFDGINRNTSIVSRECGDRSNIPLS